MRLHLLAPTIVDFSGAPGSALRDADAYEQFWRDRSAGAAALIRELAPPRPPEPSDGGQQEAGESGPPGPGLLPLPRLSLDHERSTGRSNRYRTIARDSLERPLHALTWALAMAHVPLDLPDGAPVAELRDCVTEITCRLYDHDVMLVEVAADVGAWFDGRGPDARGLRTDELQEAAVDLGAAVARACHDRYVEPVLSWLRGTDRRGTVVSPSDENASYPSGQEPGNVLWVARALVADPGAGDVPEQVLRHWLKDIPPGEGEGEAPAALLVSGELGHVTRWLNYAYVPAEDGPDAVEPGGRFEDEWEALRCAQFFYAALDTVDSRLSMVLAEAFTADTRWELNRLKGELGLLSGRAQLVLMQFHDIAKYLKRSVRQEMDAIMAYWAFSEVVEAPVVAKVEACQQRLADLGAKQAARSALFTDLILLGIGITSVVGTALGLAEFGRVMASDPSLSTYDVGRGDLTGWFAAQPADAILVASGAVSILLIIVYFYFRRTHES